MSPEQARGEPLDARTDIFSFGAVLYEMATHTRAFGGSTTAMVFDAILHHEPPPIHGMSAIFTPSSRSRWRRIASFAISPPPTFAPI